jgi:hypothetical protein
MANDTAAAAVEAARVAIFMIESFCGVAVDVFDVGRLYGRT